MVKATNSASFVKSQKENAIDSAGSIEEYLGKVM